MMLQTRKCWGSSNKSLVKFRRKSSVLSLLVYDHDQNDIEGKSGQILIILEFESETAALAFYNSPEYQAIVDLRVNASKGWVPVLPNLSYQPVKAIPKNSQT